VLAAAPDARAEARCTSTLALPPTTGRRTTKREHLDPAQLRRRVESRVISYQVELAELARAARRVDVMTTSPSDSTVSGAMQARVPLRLELRRVGLPGHVDGAWWPQTRALRVEAADLVDHFPPEVGRVNRLLFSRPDWDDGVVDGRGVRRIQAARGPVKVGSFPRDDTHQMILSMASGRQLRLLVIPSNAEGSEARRLLEASSDETPSGRSTALDHT
jgi:hypothetical protein